MKEGKGQRHPPMASLWTPKIRVSSEDQAERMTWFDPHAFHHYYCPLFCHPQAPWVALNQEMSIEAQYTVTMMHCPPWALQAQEVNLSESKSKWIGVIICMYSKYAIAVDPSWPTFVRKSWVSLQLECLRLDLHQQTQILGLTWCFRQLRRRRTCWGVCMSSCRWIKISQQLELCIHFGSCSFKTWLSLEISRKSEARFCWHVLRVQWSSSWGVTAKKDQMLQLHAIEVDRTCCGTSGHAILPGLKEVRGWAAMDVPRWIRVGRCHDCEVWGTLPARMPAVNRLSGGWVCGVSHVDPGWNLNAGNLILPLPLAVVVFPANLLFWVMVIGLHAKRTGSWGLPSSVLYLCSFAWPSLFTSFHWWLTWQSVLTFQKG